MITATLNAEEKNENLNFAADQATLEDYQQFKERFLIKHAHTCKKKIDAGFGLFKRPVNSSLQMLTDEERLSVSRVNYA